MFKKDDCVTLTIEDIGTDGAGIGKADGYTLFVKDAVIGDVIRAKIMKAKKELRLRSPYGNYNSVKGARRAEMSCRETVRRLPDTADVV